MALFEALAELMGTHSFDKITLSDVASRAGVGRTAVYNHFADKEDLLLAFIEHEASLYAEDLSQALAEARSPIDRLRVYVRQQALIKRNYHHPAAGALATTVSNDTASRLRSHARQTTQLLEQILRDAIDAGQIPDQDLSQVIPLIHACVMGGRPTPSDPDARAEYLSALDAFVLRAVGAAAPEPSPTPEVVPQGSGPNG